MHPDSRTCARKQVTDTKKIIFLQCRNTFPDSVGTCFCVCDTQEEDLQDGRLHFSGYNNKDETTVKNTQTNANPPPPAPAVPKDTDGIRKRFVDRAKRIDTVSRAAFPLAFLIFNVFYWITYKIIRHQSAGRT